MNFIIHIRDWGISTGLKLHRIKREYTQTKTWMARGFNFTRRAEHWAMSSLTDTIVDKCLW